MATSTGTHGGSGLSRSEAAILAWKKRARAPKPGALDPKIAARVKEILAEKAAKGKKKAKGAGGKGKAKGKGAAAKPKGTPQEQSNQNRAAVAKQGGMGDLEGALVRVGAGMARGGEDLEPDAHDKLIDKGLAQRHADGSVTLSPAGKKWKAAADKGDADGAAAALNDAKAGRADSAAKEKATADKKQEQATAKQAKQAEAGKKKQEAATAKVAKQQAQQKKLKQAAQAKKEKATGVAPKATGVSRVTPPKEQAANRAKVAKDMADSDTGLSPSGSQALGDLADGKPLSADTAKEFESMGLTEKGKLTAEGRTAVAQMNKGNTRMAVDAINRAKKRKPTAKAIDMDEPWIEIGKIANDALDSIKAGARHSRTDMQHLQGIHDSAVACGASCATESDDSGETDPQVGDDAEKAVKSIMDNPEFYAQHECSDVAQAANALSNIALLISSELSEEDEDDTDVSQLCDAARILVKFIGSELDELEGAAGDAAAGRTAGDVPMAKSIELGTLPDGEELATLSGYAIKAMGEGGLVGGYLVKFGGDGDLSQYRDVFTKSTNFGSHTKSDVWVHHRMLPGLGKKQLTNQAELGMDDEGVFVKHLLDLRSSYERKLYDMVQAGKLGWSSGTAPHLVERKTLGDGRHEITQWTLGLDASYTPMPAGGFSVDAGAMKSLFDDAGIDLLNAMFIDDGSQEAGESNSTKADGRQVDEARTRALLLELSLMELEETAR